MNKKPSKKKAARPKPGAPEAAALMGKERILDIVKRHLAGHQPKEYELHALPDARLLDGWWHVPVMPDKPVRHAYDYYHVLAVVEIEIEDEEGEINVLLVPETFDPKKLVASA